MLVSKDFKKTVAISLILHAAVFGMFSFSFGDKFPTLTQTSLSFLGQSLERSQVYLFPPVSLPPAARPITVKTGSFSHGLDTSLSRIESAREAHRITGQLIKPAYALSRIEAKETYSQKTTPIEIAVRKRDPDLILYPVLPYSFTLYFQDRQVAHVELMFKIVSAGLRNSVIVKRRVSSGNLDADLVSMRYISHYLFMQQAKIPHNTWHTVKIDLSAKDR